MARGKGKRKEKKREREKKKKVETTFKLHPFYIQAGSCRKSASEIETQTLLPHQGSVPGTEQLLSLPRVVSGVEAEAPLSQEVGAQRL